MSYLSACKVVSLSVLGVVCLSLAWGSSLHAQKYSLKKGDVVTQGDISNYLPNYTQKTAEKTPMAQATQWIKAYETDAKKKEGMLAQTAHLGILATYNEATGRIAQATVYIVEVCDDGLIFFSSPDSLKITNALTHPSSSIHMSWLYPDRGEQIEFVGTLSPLDETTSNSHSTRPEGKRDWKPYILKPVRAMAGVARFYDQVDVKDTIVPIVDRVAFDEDKDGQWSLKSLKPYYGGHHIRQELESGKARPE